MKTLFILLFALISISAMAQIVGVDFLEATDIHNAETQDEGFFFTDNHQKYILTFSNSPVGIKHCMSRLTTLLKDNGEDISHPDVDDSMLASYVEGLFDYENLNLSLSTEGSEVRKGWKLSNDWWIALSLTKNTKAIFINPPKK